MVDACGRDRRSEPKRARRRAATTRRRAAALLLLAIAAAPIACASPNRGRWRGTFAGGVAGEMEFTVNARGTRADGRISGTTSRGETFEAEFEGSLNQGFLNARFEGSGQTGVGLPAGFAGNLQGTLEAGAAEGHWSVDLKQVRAHYEGTWSATQIED